MNSGPYTLRVGSIITAPLNIGVSGAFITAYMPTMETDQLIIDDNTKFVHMPEETAERAVIAIDEDGSAKVSFIKVTSIQDGHVLEARLVSQLRFHNLDSLKKISATLQEAIDTHEKREP